jgi:RNA polymerase sigma-70 factor (ECF subfamily)
VAEAREERDDATLLAAHVAGDRDAFGELFRRHRHRLWSVAIRVLGDREEAADAVQDAMVSAYRAAASFRGEAAVSTWLHRVVVNACLDRARKLNAHPVVPLTAEVASGLDRPDTRADDQLAAGELRSALRAALATLPPDHRIALVLVDMEGYPVDEVARMLGIPSGTVKSRCARARARLVPLLADLRHPREAGNPGNLGGGDHVKRLAAEGGGER